MLVVWVCFIIFFIPQFIIPAILILTISFGLSRPEKKLVKQRKVKTKELLKNPIKPRHSQLLSDQSYIEDVSNNYRGLPIIVESTMLRRLRAFVSRLNLDDKFINDKAQVTINSVRADNLHSQYAALDSCPSIFSSMKDVGL